MSGHALGRRAAVLGILAGTVLLALHTRSPARAEAPLAYEMRPLPAHVDSLTSLADVDATLAMCTDACRGVVYLWTARMPLSRSGIPHAVAAAERLGMPLMLVAFEELHEYAAGSDVAGTPTVADALLAAGALAHAPALVVLQGGEAVGPAILGYKSESAYEALLAGRTGSAALADAPVVPTTVAWVNSAETLPRVLTDYEVVGVPGAYFRWVPGRNAVAYESGQRVYLLDLESGESRASPGFVDFVPTPDGRYFVTPRANDGGLEFYDAERVFEGVASGRISDIDPIFTDLRMRDQYPSVGILERGESHTHYRVLTSWFDAVVYRDYDVRVDPRTGLSSVRPMGEPIPPCRGLSLSTPMMSQDGHEVAARDEASGTTKIFRFLDDGTCEALVDLGVPTSKVGWHATGRSLAFSIPRRGRRPGAAELGIFVFDRDARRLTHIPGSEAASRLAFPDFIRDEVIYLVPGATARQTSFFRVVDVPR